MDHGERIARLEGVLEQHLKACERKHSTNLGIMLTVLAGVIALLFNNFTS